MDISIELINSLDLEKYLGFVFEYKSNYGEGDWIPPTDDEREYFSEWRTLTLERSLDLFKSRILFNPLPKHFIIEELINYKLEELVEGKSLSNCFFEIICGSLPKDFYTLAILCGEIDFLKQLNRELIIKIDEPQQSNLIYSPVPCFKSELVEEVIATLNIYFDISQHAELKRIIETGSDTYEKLFFRDNGNRLNDYFKKLFENETITVCSKKDLINWIVKNFTFNHRKIQKDFIYKTVEKVISGNQQPCKNPII